MRHSPLNSERSAVGSPWLSASVPLFWVQKWKAGAADPHPALCQLLALRLLPLPPLPPTRFRRLTPRGLGPWDEGIPLIPYIPYFVFILASVYAETVVEILAVPTEK